MELRRAKKHIKTKKIMLEAKKLRRKKTGCKAIKKRGTETKWMRRKIIIK